MTKINLLEEYNKHKKKYSLPDFKPLDEEYEITNIQKNLQDPKLILKFVRRRINEKITFFVQILETMLSPNPNSIINITESKFLPEEERENMEALLKTLMYFERYSILLDVTSDDKSNASFIKEVWQEWPKFKKTIEEYAKILKNKWKEEEEKAIAEHYFG